MAYFAVVLGNDLKIDRVARRMEERVYLPLSIHRKEGRREGKSSQLSNSIQIFTTIVKRGKRRRSLN